MQLLRFLSFCIFLLVGWFCWFAFEARVQFVCVFGLSLSSDFMLIPFIVTSLAFDDRQAFTKTKQKALLRSISITAAVISSLDLSAPRVFISYPFKRHYTKTLVAKTVP